MELTGRTLWNWHRTDTTSRWCLDWDNGQLPATTETVRTLLRTADAAMWPKWRLLTAFEEVVPEAVEEIAIKEETAKTTEAMGTAVEEEPASARALAAAEVEASKLPLQLILTVTNSPSLI